MPRRRFGSVRQMPSGKFQARFIDPQGIRRNAPDSFRSETDAQRWLDAVDEKIRRGQWMADDGASRRNLKECCNAYLTENPRIGPRWKETCERNMRLHLAPLLDLPIIAITAPVIRSWHANAMRGNGGKTSIAQSYRFIRAVFAVAVEDGVLDRNPCRIPGAASPKTAERSIATPAQVAALIDAITPRCKAAVALAAWCGLRRGEICALRVEDIDLTHGVVHVRKNWVELLESPTRYEKEPKSEAGKRTVTVPPHVLDILKTHAQEFAGDELFFVGRDGQRMRGNALYQAFVRAREKAGVSLAFHDLRHTGQSLAAASGANLADLRKRLGHSTNATAQRYLHTVEGRDVKIADALSKLAENGDASHLPDRLS